MSDDETYLTPQQLSERWNGAVSVATLMNWRYMKRGPPFTKVGRSARYAMSKLLEWERKNTTEEGVTANGKAAS